MRRLLAWVTDGSILLFFSNYDAHLLLFFFAQLIEGLDRNNGGVKISSKIT